MPPHPSSAPPPSLTPHFRLVQLLTLNEENVLRFRHECFLMKNLSHPNVVKLVGVCWSEELFACCLEFVENGSLEDWLRRTVGGKKYERASEASALGSLD